jgi:hypothetical protein
MGTDINMNPNRAVYISTNNTSASWIDYNETVNEIIQCIFFTVHCN